MLMQFGVDLTNCSLGESCLRLISLSDQLMLIWESSEHHSVLGLDLHMVGRKLPKGILAHAAPKIEMGDQGSKPGVRQQDKVRGTTCSHGYKLTTTNWKTKARILRTYQTSTRVPQEGAGAQ